MRFWLDVRWTHNPQHMILQLTVFKQQEILEPESYKESTQVMCDAKFVFAKVETRQGSKFYYLLELTLTDLMEDPTYKVYTKVESLLFKKNDSYKEHSNQ